MSAFRLSIAAIALVAGGCATMAPPSAVKLVPMQATKPLPAVADLRPAEARVYRETETSSTISKLLGDDVLQPQMLGLLQHQLADALPPGRERARIELRQADIGFWIPMDSVPAPTVPSISIAIGPINVGALIGAGIAYGMRRAAAPEYAVAYILVTIDGEAVAAYEQIPISQDLSASDALKQAVHGAVDLLRGRVSAIVPAN